MVAVITNLWANQIFSRFIYSSTNVKSNNLNIMTNYVLNIKGLFIKNQNILYALFAEENTSLNRIILGVIDMQKYTF